MRHQATRDLFDYWNALRGERAAPERGDIDPGAIRNILADSFMLEVDLNERFPFRLAGTRVNGLFGEEQKGQSFLSKWRAEESRNIAAVLITVIDGACPVVAGAVGAPSGQEECAFELLFLPLRHHGQTHARILGLITAVTKPVWVGLLPVGGMSLRSLRILDQEMIDPVQHPLSLVGNGRVAAAGQAARCAIPSAAITLGAPDLTTARPHLRLIRGGL